MSEAELYMPDTNQSFDLPRWQTHVEPLSSSAQAAHAAQASYLYPGPPPPPPQSLSAASPQRQQPIQQTPTGPTRHRISQLIDDQQPTITSPYLSTGHNQLARSASLGGSATGNTPSSRARRHHQPEDLEGAFNIDSQSRPSNSQLAQNSFYPSSAAYQQQSLTGPGSLVGSTASPADSYTDMYYNGSATQSAKRPQQGLEPSSSAHASRSPLRGPNSSNSAAMMDSYSQQSQYSPTTTSYPYGPPQDQRPHPATYHSHSRNHSQVKSESMTPPINSPYTPQTATLNSAAPYSSSYSMDTSSPNPPTQLQTHLSAHVPNRQNSTSNPPTPLSYMHSQSPAAQYYPQDQAMVVDPPPQRRRASGFRRVRAAHDLQPRLDIPPMGRRMGSDGVYLSPLRQLTTNIVETYHICNPQFRYESAHNPRRVLTKPSKPAHNDGYDNEDYDYILYVNDWLGTEEGHKYLILDILGQGTFGQVVKCQNMKTHEIVAVKVVKNKPAYFNQSMMEVTILEMLNKTCDPNDEHHILRLRDSFIHRSHLCLVFELLSSNLYELIKQNQFQGLSTQLVKVFMAQLLDAMTVLKEARLIHCDLKPENILLKSLQSPQIKVIDFGSACHERQTVYTYIQSRFYRSPEVLLGMSYTASIDMWSLGCIAVELFLGLPLFPGTSEYNQLTRIIDMLGMPPLSMLNTGKQTSQFFDSYEVWNPQTNQNEKRYRLKSIEQYSREHNTNEQPGKQYFKATSLPEIINTAPMPTSKSSRTSHEVEKELNNRASFIDFCQGLLNLNPVTRWTPQQARLHPFITGEKFTKPFVPDGLNTAQPSGTSTSTTTDPKRPYGGLVPSQPKGTRAYQDAATYNQHLNQHQAYTAHQAASQNAPTYRNPYIAPPQQQQPQQQHHQQHQQQLAPSSYSGVPDGGNAYQQHQNAQYAPNQGPPGQHRLVHQTSTGQLGTPYAGQLQGLPPSSQVHLNPNVPSNAYSHNARARANTINQTKEIPPALARLQRMDNIPRDALTPVLNRDDAMQEWERRQAGKPAAPPQSYPQIEYLQQQAELAAASGSLSWNTPGGSGGVPVNSARYPPPPSKLAHSYHPQTIMVDDDNGRREVVMSNVRSAARGDGSTAGGSGGGNSGMFGASGSGVISNPPQAYASNATTSGNRYATTYPQAQQQHQAPPAPQQQQQAQGGSGVSVPFDTLDRRSDMSNMYVPMQPDQYQPYSTSGASARHVAVPPQAVPPSFYGAGVVSTGPLQSTQQQQQQRNPFSVPEGLQPMSSAKHPRTGGGGSGGGSMDPWPR
ncbi:putative serine/Threonine protein kinases, catalytic domain [Lyophyllum shimeji]|uniref:Serine/Threonine protein kinases, catalytic domain n=1 Tax=Lyophyllum shimeji TaxID=47721 RepID=A0A9P3ULF9_LYOSH|nr:putative serine/Threonine protein kinases, catalytic domain [Lyophyllum shimeji]